MTFLKTAWSVVSTWWSGLNITLIEVGLAVTVVVGLLLATYQAGRRSGLATEQTHIAENNIKQALKYQADVESANDAADRERQRATVLEDENNKLKDQVQNVAKGNASVGVDAAIHGVPKQTAPARKPQVSSSKN